jgi:SAM-dependent MidA family methyltransferase
MHLPEPVSHEIFMERALYHVTDGYYSNHAAVGQRGDFSTSATLCPAFAEAIAAWAKKTAKDLGLAAPCPLIELGPGNGALAKGLREHLPDWPLHLVETSEPLQAAQCEALAKAPQRTHTPVALQHHTDLRSALKATGGIGLIVANEFIDAFPAVKLRWQSGDWNEVGVQYADGSPQEILAPLEREIDADAPAHPREGETIYVHPSFHHWLRENIPSLRHGALLFIDYGAERPARECRAYAGQERYEGLPVYESPGSRDITCDVNFTDLARWCGQLGLKPKPLITQAEFLRQQLKDFEERSASDEALAFLAAPFGAGGAFKILCLTF